METFLSPSTLDTLSKASGFVVIALIAILVIFALIQTILSNRTASKQNSEETKILLNLLTENVSAQHDNAAAMREIVTAVKIIEKALNNQDRVVAQIMGAVEAQGVINAKLGDTLTLVEISFRTHIKAMTDTLAMLSFDVNDLQDIVNKRADGLTVIVERVLARLDALPIEVGVVVKEHIAVMLLQSTPPPKVITGEVRAAILDGADKKPRVNGAVTDESQKGVD